VFLGAGVQNNGNTFQEVSPVAVGYNGSQEMRVVKGRIEFTQITNTTNGTAVDPLSATTLYTVSGGLKQGTTAKGYLMSVTFANPMNNLGPNGTVHVTATSSINNVSWLQEGGTYYSYPVIVMNPSSTGFDVMLLSGSGTTFPSYTNIVISIDFTATGWYKA
jgi:hypothetical protein